MKALDNGWDVPKHFNVRDDGDLVVLASNKEFKYSLTYTPDQILFNHNFAKALWGETKDFVELGKTFESGVVTVAIDGWQYHLQQMVIAEDPIEYLGENM